MNDVQSYKAQVFLQSSYYLLVRKECREKEIHHYAYARYVSLSNLISFYFEYYSTKFENSCKLSQSLKKLQNARQMTTFDFTCFNL